MILCSAPENEGEGESVVGVAVEMSLDEWKALQEQNRPKKEFNLRKADTIVPSDSVVIHKSKKQVEVRICTNAAKTGCLISLLVSFGPHCITAN